MAIVMARLVNGPGGDDHRALPERLRMEPVILATCHRLAPRVLVGHRGGVHVALELDVAAQRQRGELPARAAPVGKTRQLLAEADRERLGLHAEQPPGEVVAELVQRDQRPQHQQEA